MRALGSPIEAPVSERGLDYITMRTLGLPIACPFCVFVSIVILMSGQSVERDPCLSNVAVLTECQCANGKCQCANGNHRLQNSCANGKHQRTHCFIAKIEHMVTDNVRTNLVRIWFIT